MRYYIIENKTDKEVGNVFPQADFISTNGVFPNELYNYKDNITEGLNFKFELRKKAKLTDVISQADIGGKGLFINEKVKNILEKHTLIKHHFVPCELIAKNKIYQYYWLHLLDSGMVNYIDYTNSVFYFTKFGMRKEIIQLSSFDEYLELKKQHGIMWGCQIDVIKFNAPPPYRL